jgi:methionyl-tRNA synthetase
MIISTYDPGHLHRSFGIDLGEVDLGPVEAFGVGANFGRVAPGLHSDPHQHDETETFVIISGHGDIVVDAKRTPIAPAMVLQFEPFETHYLDNTGDDDILFATFYWRDAPRAAKKAPRTDRRRFGERPVFVFSTPPTPNGGLHIGHLSGPYLGTDAYVRFQRMNGTRVYHLAATDDFQSYVADCARREGRSPAEVARAYATEITETLAAMDIHPDQVNHTSRTDGYQQALQAFFTRLTDSGRVAKAAGLALFDGETGQYLYEPYVDGGCPGCGNETGGNICEICGEPNFCTDLADPRPATGTATPRQAEIVRYTLDLHELADDLRAHHSVGRAPAKVRELAHRLFSTRDRLDMALTHPSDWGVRPVPDDVPGQVIWVWIELAFGFIYGIETLGRTLGEDWSASAPADDWKIVHFLGYDNTFYHSILSPALYKIANPGWTPDVDYNVNEFYLLDGDKFSTSRGHVIWGKDFLSTDNVDAVRFYLALTRPETRRTNFTLDGYLAVVTGTLVGRWQRWLDDLGTRLQERYGGIVPDAGIWTPEHTAFLTQLQNWLGVLTGALGQDGFSLNQAAKALDGLVADAVRFSDFESATAGLPEWKDEARTAIALELAAARLLAHCAAPVMPRFAARLGAALGIGEPVSWPELVTLIPPGTKVKLAGQVFFRDQDDAGLAEPDLLPWLCGVVAEGLALADPADPGATLVALGSTSMQAIALQYQILQRTGIDITIDDLLGDRPLADIAGLLEQRRSAAPEGDDQEVTV